MILVFFVLIESITHEESTNYIIHPLYKFKFFYTKYKEYILCKKKKKNISKKETETEEHFENPSSSL